MCNITPEDMFSVSEACAIPSAQYCCALLHKSNLILWCMVVVIYTLTWNEKKKKGV